MATLDEINALLSQGITQKEIARRLGMPIKTLEHKLRLQRYRCVSQTVISRPSTEPILKNQWYLLPCGDFARVQEVSEALEYVTVSLHKSPLDEIVLLNGSNTEQYTRIQISLWRLWDSVNCRTFSKARSV